VTDEFDKWLPHGFADHTMGCNNVSYAEEWKKDTDPDDFQRLEEHVLPSKPRQTLVPDRCQ